MATSPSSILRASVPAPAAGVAATLSFYSPGLRQGSHDHAEAHLSVVLAGGFEEQRGSETVIGHAGDMLHRQPGVRHNVAFGPSGALVLVLRACAEGVDPSRFVPRVARARLTTPPPEWLLAARQRLTDNPLGTTLAGLAREFGVHRVHLSRSLTAHFGAPPSVLRREAMVGRALALALAENEPLAACAHAAGFADQSHLTRAVRAVCGFPPARLRRLLG